MTTPRAQQDFEAWQQWKQDPGPHTLGPLYGRIQPIIKSESSKWAQTGIKPPLLEAHAQDLAFDALHTYDPNSGTQLNTHITNHLKKMNRYVIKNQQTVRVQETKVFDYRRLERAREELTMELGREPTDTELQAHAGVDSKIMNYTPVIEHFYSKNIEEGGKAPVMEELSMHATALAMMHQNLGPKQKQIFEKAYGYGGVQPQPKKDIAKDLGITPAAVSKHLRKIEKQYQEYASASDAMSGGTFSQG
jgi:DNA-directed RNA polymerase specialized sigma subunit